MHGLINNIPAPVGCIEAVAEEVADAADGLTTVVTIGNGTAWGQKRVKFCLIMQLLYTMVLSITYHGFINNIPELVGCIEAVAEEVAVAADGLGTVDIVGNGTA